VFVISPVAGAFWEGFMIENNIAAHKRWRPSFLRTSNGAEIYLLLERAGRCRIFEFKLSKAPKPSHGFYELAQLLKPESARVIAPKVFLIAHQSIWRRQPRL